MNPNRWLGLGIVALAISQALGNYIHNEDIALLRREMDVHVRLSQGSADLLIQVSELHRQILAINAIEAEFGRPGLRPVPLVDQQF